MQLQILLLFLNLSFFSSSNISFFLVEKHPVHISLTNIEYIEKKGFLVTFKFFKDDFEQNFLTEMQTRLLVDKLNPDKDKSLITRYIKKNFQILINEKKIEKSTFKDYKTNNEAIWLNYFFPTKSKLKSVQINNYFLIKQYRDQKNLVILEIKGLQKAYSLDYNTKTFILKL